MNTLGLDFYDRLVDELLENGIEPFVTLYHWDLPQALEDRGGWPVRGTVDAWVEYTEVVAARLGDRVRHWITLNEPWVAAWLGYGTGQDAPGRTSEADAVAAGHHLLLAHGRAVEVLRRDVPGAKVGITIDLRADASADRSPKPMSARLCTKTRFATAGSSTPSSAGDYPAEGMAQRGPLLPPFAAEDLRDDLGAARLRRDQLLPTSDRPGESARRGADGREPRGRRADGNGLGGLTRTVSTSSSSACTTRTTSRRSTSRRTARPTPIRRVNGSVPDPERASYIERHLEAVARAIADGVPVAGYFVWSLLDNFEWSRGYSQRFGIVYVDFATLERVPKTSYRAYRDFIAAQRARVARSE